MASLILVGQKWIHIKLEPEQVRIELVGISPMIELPGKWGAVWVRPGAVDAISRIDK